MTAPAQTALTIGVIGKDGRTDALAAACAASPRCAAVEALTEVLSPGLVARCGAERVTCVDDICDLDTVRAWAEQVRPSLVVVGPEEPLAAGVVDLLQSMGVACFGPTKQLAQVEASKTWTRRLVAAHGIPGNPAFWSVDDPAQLEELLAGLDAFVVKADGLRGGKGVRVYPEHFTSRAEAVQFGTSAIAEDGSVLVEERLDGEEFSLMTITDGVSVVHCPVVQDHKRAYVGDTGPNTGGMGSYSCEDHSLPFLTAKDIADAQEINRLTIEALERETGERYRGVLYGGFMATADGVRLIEFNCRFGDPEVLDVLPLLATDFVDVADAVVRGELGALAVQFDRKATVCKYVVPEEYPIGKSPGGAITVPDDVLADPDVRLYWAAATVDDNGQPRLTGSRALGVVGIGPDLRTAEQRAEHAAARITSTTAAAGGKVRYRSDIGTPELIERRIEHMRALRG